MTFNAQLTSCKNMFKDLPKLLSEDLTNFDSSLVTEMNSFFEGCTSLISVDFSNKEVPELISTFKGCKSLTSVKFDNFRAKKIKDLSELFFKNQSI